MSIIWSSIFFLYGIVLGSFFNVVGLRFPLGMSILGRSQCQVCKKSLTWKELIPIISYLVQNGRCRTCNTKISAIYPAMEFVTGVLFVLTYWKIGLHVDIIIPLALISLAMIVFITDITYLIVPNQILLFFLPIFTILVIISPLDPWYNSLVGAFIGIALIGCIIIISRGGMGMGDMKLLGLFGITLGFQKVLVTFFIATIVGSLLVCIFLWKKKVNRKEPIPFAPFLIIGMLISYFYGNELILFYLSFI